MNESLKWQLVSLFLVGAPYGATYFFPVESDGEMWGLNLVFFAAGCVVVFFGVFGNVVRGAFGNALAIVGMVVGLIAGYNGILLGVYALGAVHLVLATYLAAGHKYLNILPNALQAAFVVCLVEGFVDALGVCAFQGQGVGISRLWEMPLSVALIYAIVAAWIVRRGGEAPRVNVEELVGRSFGI